jgi:hypothetical protein
MDMDVVEDMVLNIKKFVRDPIIILHVNSCFEDFDFNKFSEADNVFINPNRFSHGQWDTKVKAITSNHDFIKNRGIDFDYEMIFYPKMLFIKHGIEEYIKDIDLCMPSPTQEKRDRMEYALNTKMEAFTAEEKEFFGNDIEKFLVEGMVFSRELSQKVYEMIKCTDLYERTGHCYEEFIFPTVAKYFASTMKNYPGIISYWELSAEDLQKIVKKSIRYFDSFFTDRQKVDDIYVIHKVDYGYNNEVRRLVREIV